MLKSVILSLSMLFASNASFAFTLVDIKPCPPGFKLEIERGRNNTIKKFCCVKEKDDGCDGGNTGGSCSGGGNNGGGNNGGNNNGGNNNGGNNNGGNNNGGNNNGGGNNGGGHNGGGHNGGGHNGGGHNGGGHNGGGNNGGTNTNTNTNTGTSTDNGCRVIPNCGLHMGPGVTAATANITNSKCKKMLAGTFLTPGIDCPVSYIISNGKCCRQ